MQLQSSAPPPPPPTQPLLMQRLNSPKDRKIASNLCAHQKKMAIKIVVRRQICTVTRGRNLGKMQGLKIKIGRIFYGLL